MKTRIITGALLGIVVIPVFIIGSWPLILLLGLFTAWATYEIYHLEYQESQDYTLLFTNLLLSLTLFTLLILYFTNRVDLEYPLSILVVSFLVGIYYRFTMNKTLSMFLLSVVYPSVGFATLFAFRDASLSLIGYIFLITIMTDVFAYFVGINYGKHKLAPSISPKKSIEGSIGGTVLSTLFVLVYLLLTQLDQLLAINTTIWGMLLLSIMISVLGQIGDLVASKMKRMYAIKDFSHIFPGHGGIMDRFDSVIFVSIIIFIINEVVTLL